jgi:hypothetical protein
MSLDRARDDNAQDTGPGDQRTYSCDWNHIVGFRV